jgi:hypothetical protein
MHPDASNRASGERTFTVHLIVSRTAIHASLLSIIYLVVSENSLDRTTGH